MARVDLHPPPTLNELFRDPFPGRDRDGRDRIRDRFERHHWRHLCLRYEEDVPAVWSRKLPGLYFLIVFRPTKGDRKSRFEICRATFLVRLAEKLTSLRLFAQVQLERVKAKIEAAREADRDRNRSAIGRILALIELDALLRLVAVLAVEALHLIWPEPPPRVLCAGGKTGLHIPLD